MSSRSSARETGLPPAFTHLGLPSFVDFVADQAPELLPAPEAKQSATPPAHGTTILALRFADGILMAGDRRATAGNIIASNQMRKVYEADSQSAIGIAGTAGLAIELVRLFQLELEHFEKIEGSLLSLEGKANRLASMIRGNLSMAVHGLGVMPVFAGWDDHHARGRIFSYDITGGRYEERDFHSVGSGSLYARGTLKGLWRPDMSSEEAVELAVRSLVDVSEEDSATAGPDPVRRIWPLIALVTDRGYSEVANQQVEDVVTEVLRQRQERSDHHRQAHNGGGQR